MSIVKSKITDNTPQVDGKLSVTAIYTDHLGGTYTKNWSLPAGTDVPQFVDSFAFTLQTQLIESEEAELEGEAMSGKVPNMTKAKHTTKSAARLRVVRRLLSQPIELGWLDSVEYLDGLTAQQIEQATGLTGKALSDARAAIKTLVNARNMLRTYVPPLVVE